MTIDEAKQTLRKHADLLDVPGGPSEAEVVEAFKVFWATAPSPEEFVAVCRGIRLYAAILYEIVTKPFALAGEPVH